MFPTLMVMFGLALEHFGDHYNTHRYFDCIQDERINCSSVQHCSTASNETDCCMDSSVKCVTNNSLLQRMDTITVLCIVIMVFTFITSWIHPSIWHYVGNNQILRIRQRLFQSLVNQDIKWFDINEPREITSRMTE